MTSPSNPLLFRDPILFYLFFLTPLPVRTLSIISLIITFAFVHLSHTITCSAPRSISSPLRPPSVVPNRLRLDGRSSRIIPRLLHPACSGNSEPQHASHGRIGPQPPLLK